MIDEARLKREADQRSRQNEAKRRADDDDKRRELEQQNAVPPMIEETTIDGSDSLRILPNRKRALFSSGGAIIRLTVVVMLGVGAVLVSQLGISAVTILVACGALAVLALHLYLGLTPSALLACKGEFYALATESGKTIAEGEKKDIWIKLITGTLTSEGKTWRGGFKVIRQGSSRYTLNGLSPADFARVKAFCNRNDVTFNERVYEGTITHG